MRSRQGLAAIYENTLENEMPNINPFFASLKDFMYVQFSISMRLG